MTRRGPLDGVLVVAIEQAVAAPLCTVRLADAGARVIKVERPGGDFARGYDHAAGGDSSYFAWTNHGKQSVVLDFKAPDDAALLHRILARTDVFVQNLAPGALTRAGFDSDDLRRRYPRLITCDISGYGESPELATRKAYDLLIQAESGLVGISGGPGELGRIGVSLCDIGTGVTAQAAILEALIARSVAGHGTAIRLSLFDVAAEWMTVPFIQHLAGASPERVGLRHPSIAPYGAYATAEGALTLVSIQNEREWERLCDVLGRPDLAGDARFVTNTRRVENRTELERVLDSLIGGLTRSELQQRLSQAAIAFGSVNSLADLVDHPALRRRTVVSSTGSTLGIPAHPVQSIATPIDSPAVPVLGADTDRIRAEFAPAEDH